jgi:hypothetical protein
MDRGRVGEERGSKETDGCPLTLPPLQKCGVTMHEDHHQIRSGERDGVEDGCVNIVHCARVFAVEQQLCMDLCVHLPLIVTLVITIELDQVLQSVVMLAAVQDSINFILFLTVNKSCGWGWCRSSAKDGIRRCWRQFDHGEDRVKVAELGGQS